MIDIAKFKAARLAVEISQGELGKRARVSQQLIGEIERGATRSTKAIYRIARALDVKAYELDPEIPAPKDAWEEAIMSARELDEDTQSAALRNLQDYINLASKRFARLKDL